MEELLKISAKDVKKGEHLGGGSYGQVYECILKSHPHLKTVVKHFNKSANEEYEEEVMLERRNSELLSGMPHCTKFLGWYQKEGEYYFVFERMNGPNLHEFFHWFKKRMPKIQKRDKEKFALRILAD